MAAHLCELLIRQRAAFFENAVRHPDFSHVMEQSDVVDIVAIRLAPAHILRKGATVGCHALRVPLRVFILRVDGPGDGENGLEREILHFAGLFIQPALQVLAVVFQLQHIGDAAAQHFGREGFDNEVTRPQRQTFGFGFRGLGGGEEDDGQLFAAGNGTDARQGFRTVHAGHEQIKKNKVRSFGMQQPQRLLSGRGEQETVFPAQNVPHGPQRRFTVVYDQNEMLFHVSSTVASSGAWLRSRRSSGSRLRREAGQPQSTCGAHLRLQA